VSDDGEFLDRLAAAVRRHFGADARAPVFELEEGDDLERGFVMPFIAGETLPRHIVRDPALAEARWEMRASRHSY
jgi:hypothetical protein